MRLAKEIINGIDAEGIPSEFFPTECEIRETKQGVLVYWKDYALKKQVIANYDRNYFNLLKEQIIRNQEIRDGFLAQIKIIDEKKKGGKK